MHSTFVPDRFSDFFKMILDCGVVCTIGAKLRLKHVIFDPKSSTVPRRHHPHYALRRIELQLDMRDDRVSTDPNRLFLRFRTPVEEPQSSHDLE